MSAIESLKKIQYETLEQFVDDLNRNFAIVENSPLYKGLPGTEGDPGDDGTRGIRGIKFLFVNYGNFTTQFPGELSVPSKIDLNFINSKISNFESKQKLFTALNITEFVDKDVIVLTNSVMLSYDVVNDFFINTGMAFNPESNLLSNINQIIEDYVTYYINNNPILNGLVNIFQIYQTYAKNYADNNSSFITSELTESSVYSPYIPGFNNTVGIHIDNHKYYGYNDVEFPISNKGTFVFGSMKRYYQLLMNTISTAGNDTLSSDYAPGAGNIPGLVILQDTYENGIYFGHKDKTNLKRFGSIFKNEDNDLVLKSDSSMIESEYAELLINRSYLRFKKLVQFFDSLEVSRDLSVFSDINNKHLKTGKFTTGAVVGNQYNTNKSEHGASGAGTVKVNVSEFEDYIHYLNRVLVTDGNGRLSKAYALETLAMNNSQLVDLTTITGIPNNQYNILTSNYFAFLANKINNITAFATANYWRKNQFNTGEIPDLKLSNKLTVLNDVDLGTGLLTVNKVGSIVELKSTTLNIDSTNIKTSQFKSNVLITDSNGNISKLYSLETGIPNITYNSLTGAMTVGDLSSGTADKKILTSTYWNYLASLLNSNSNFMLNNYWRKNQFETGEIPGLKLSTSLITNGIVQFDNSHGIHLLLQKSSDGLSTIFGIGNNSDSNPTQLNFRSSKVQFNKFTNKILVTDSTGNVLNQYLIATGDITYAYNNLTNNGVAYTVPVLTLPNNDDANSLPVWKHVKVLGTYLNTFTSWIQTNFWRKDQYNTGEIPNMTIGNVLKALGNVSFGPTATPNFSTSGSSTNVGRTTGFLNLFGTVKLPSYIKNILVTGADGTVLTNYSLDESTPSFSNPTLAPGADPYDFNTIKNNYWIKASQPQNLLTYPNDPLKIPNSKHWDFLATSIAVAKELIFDRPTYAEMVSSGLPIGSVIAWTNTIGPVPNGFVICDGRLIPGTSTATPNLINKFLKGSLSPNIVGGNVNHKKILIKEELPYHTHTIPPHTHQYSYYSREQDVGSSGDGSAGVEDSRQTFTTTSGGGGVTGPVGNNQEFSIEPHSHTVIWIMKYIDGTGVPPVITPTSEFTITSYDKPTGAIYFVRNYGTSGSVTVQTSTNGGTTWGSSTASSGSPRYISPATPTGTLIRLLSTVDATYSNVITVP